MVVVVYGMCEHALLTLLWKEDIGDDSDSDIGVSGMLCCLGAGWEGSVW